MTKCRRLFFKRLFVDHYPLHLACFSADISTKTGYRWFREQQLTGRVEPSRYRKSIPGVMMQRDQDILFVLVKRNPTFHYDEYADSLFEETGHAYSKRQIRQVMSRAAFVYKLANEQAPIERDHEFRRFWREQVIFPGGPLRAEHLLYIDETNKKNGDCARSRVHCVRGQHVQIPVRATNLGFSASVIASISIEGIQSSVGVDIARDGNVNGEMFVEIFKRDILPICQAWPGKRSVVILDNAAIHMKYLIDAECAAKGVIALYLPPYSFDFNPIELVFNIAKMKLQREYGHGILPHNLKIHQIFSDCISNCVTPNQACNIFEHCFIPVTLAERAWANRG
jgi:transposase